jgi:molybdate transport system permease protein
MTLKKLFIALSLSILLLYGSLLLSALYFIDPAAMSSILSAPRTLHAIWTSLAAATLATLIALIIAIPSGYALSRYQFPLKKTVDILLELPMVISPAAIGALLLIFFQTPPGLFFRNEILDVVYTFSGIVIAQFVTILGIGTRMIKAVFDEIPVRYEHIARTMGANPWQAFRRISLPIAGNGIIYTGILSWAKAIGEFGATITLAGAMSMHTETLPTALFMRLSVADIKGTIVYILLLFFLSMLVLGTTRYWLNKSEGA